MKIAVLLMAYGGPGSLEEVEPFLKHVLHRAELPPGMVAASQNRYRQIGSKSPLLEITQQQADALAARLADRNPDGDVSYQVYIGMKNWHPFIYEAVSDIAAEGFDRLVGICMTPQYSDYAVGGYFRLLREAMQAAGIDQVELRQVESWHTQPSFVQAWTQNIRTSLAALSPEAQQEAVLLFTAHSLPLRMVPAEDPYPEHVLETAQVIARALDWPEERMTACYQCIGRGGEWLGPGLDETITTAVERGYRNLVVVPAGFLTDHVETLYDLDIELLDKVEALGLKLVRVPSLNSAPHLIEALAELVIGKVMDEG